MKGLLPTPNTGPFFPSNTAIQTEIKFGRHWHSELSATPDTPISRLTHDITQYFTSTPDTQNPFHEP